MVSVTRTETSPTTLTPRRLYRVLAIAETVTWTLLIIGMLLKYVVQVGDWPVTVAGMTHGIVFVSYAFTAGLVGVNQRWSPLQIAGAVATAIVPYATIPFDRRLERRGMLEGGWRREKTDDPRDATWVSACLRFFLAHPVLLSVLLVVAVAVVVSVLLILGPPTQWGA
jgi:integral membrane protein